MKKQLLYLAFISLIFASCAKDIVFPDGSGPGNGAPNPGGGSSNSNLLAGKTWKLIASTSVVEDGGSSFSFDLFALLPTCQLDNTVTYNANGTASTDEGATKCDPSAPQTQTGGKWSLSSDNKTLLTEFPAYMGMTSLNAEVLQLDNDFFKIRYVTTANGAKATTTTTYAKVK